jgi:hypothetical protein
MILCCLGRAVTLSSSSHLQSSVPAFAPIPRRFTTKEKWPILYMGKGFGSARSKQDDLARKMELIKKQRGNGEAATNIDERAGESTSPSSSSSSSSSSVPTKDKEEKLQEERELFSKLLAENPPPRQEERSFTRIESSSRSAVVPPSQAPFGTSNESAAPKVKAKDLKRKRKASMAEQNAMKTKGTCCSYARIR